jgi:hypothetical protein
MFVILQNWTEVTKTGLSIRKLDGWQRWLKVKLKTELITENKPGLKLFVQTGLRKS